MRQARGRAGVCRFCGCTEVDACVVDNGLDMAGCSWTDRTYTVCSACEPAARAEAQQLRATMLAGDRALERAYHHGFVIGWFVIRGNFRRNPYGRPLRGKAYAWDRGLLAGDTAGRQYRLMWGPLPNAPRRAVLVSHRRPTRPGRRVSRERG